MSYNVAPQQKQPKLIVVTAFDKNEDRAIRLAKSLAQKHAAVIAWARDANPDLGEYGPPTILFQSGDVPEME